jgi:hypothetical protein
MAEADRGLLQAITAHPWAGQRQQSSQQHLQLLAKATEALPKKLGKAGEKLIKLWDLNDLKDDTMEMKEHVHDALTEANQASSEWFSRGDPTHERMHKEVVRNLSTQLDNCPLETQCIQTHTHTRSHTRTHTHVCTYVVPPPPPHTHTHTHTYIHYMYM